MRSAHGPAPPAGMDRLVQQGFAVLRVIAERDAVGKHTTEAALAEELGCDVHDPDLRKTLEKAREGGDWVEGVPIDDEERPLIKDMCEPENMEATVETTKFGREALKRHDDEEDHDPQDSA